MMFIFYLGDFCMHFVDRVKRGRCDYSCLRAIFHNGEY